MVIQPPERGGRDRHLPTCPKADLSRRTTDGGTRVLARTRSMGGERPPPCGRTIAPRARRVVGGGAAYNNHEPQGSARSFAYELFASAAGRRYEPARTSMGTRYSRHRDRVGCISRRLFDSERLYPDGCGLSR